METKYAVEMRNDSVAMNRPRAGKNGPCHIKERHADPFASDDSGCPCLQFRAEQEKGKSSGTSNLD